ncbi:MAG TPA: hypothetical protein VFL42_14640 [Terriglobales bacterium]|nr:hypothetical protein [Terriglobales bacterium]
MATLVTMSNPRLPGSVVGEASIHLKQNRRKVTSVRFGQGAKDMYLKEWSWQIGTNSRAAMHLRTGEAVVPDAAISCGDTRVPSSALIARAGTISM